MTSNQLNILTVVCILVLTGYGIAKIIDSRPVITWPIEKPLVHDTLTGGPGKVQQPLAGNGTQGRTRKIDCFNDVAGLQASLNRIGIGKLKKWQQDGLKWISSSGFYAFGSPGQNGLPCHFTYSLESPSDSTVQALTLKVNINNMNEKHMALMEYASLAKRTLLTIGAPIPVGFTSALLNGEAFEDQNETCSIQNVYESNTIDSWTLVIVSR